MTNKSLSNEIVLVTPRERVARALTLASAFTGGLIGLGLLYTASPIALMIGCASIIRDGIGLLMAEKQVATDKMKDFMPPDRVWSPIIHELSSAAGLKKPITLLAAQQGEFPATITLNKKHFMRLPAADERRIDDASPHIVSHEFAHVARGDNHSSKSFLALNGLYGGVKRLTVLAGLACVPIGAWSAGLALASAAALFHLTGVPMRKIDQEDNLLITKGKTSVHEMEAERVAFELTGLPLTISIYTTQKEMVQHCAQIGAPLPAAFAYLPKAAPIAPLDETFNKICSFICKPKTMKRPGFTSDSPLIPLFRRQRTALPGTDLHNKIAKQAALHDAFVKRQRALAKAISSM